MRDSLQDILVADLTKFAYTQGYTDMDKNKSSTNWLVLKNPATSDKIMINKKGRQGVMFFKNTDPGLDQDRGNIINFCINRLDGYPHPQPKPDKATYSRAFKVLKSFIGAPEIANFQFKQKKKTGKSNAAKLNDLRDRTALTSEYLKEYRKIDPDILNHPLWAGTVKESKAILKNNMVIYNTAFIKKDIDGSTVGYVTHYYSKRKNAHQKIVNEKKEGLFYSNFIDSPEHLYIGETAIDCISHYQATKPDKANYISIEGQISENKIKLVNQLIDAKGKPSQINSITDNDYSGYVFDLQMAIGYHNHNNRENPIEIVQNEHYTRYVLHGKPEIADKIKKEIKEIFNKESLVNNSDHLKAYLNIGYTKNFSFVELPRDKKRNLFRFMNPLIKQVYKENNIDYYKRVPPTLDKAIKPTKDWNEFLQQKTKLRSIKTPNKLKTL